MIVTSGLAYQGIKMAKYRNIYTGTKIEAEQNHRGQYEFTYDGKDYTLTEFLFEGQYEEDEEDE